ncbi:hypothetical protein [Rossellomorea marisflavi]|uniref:hypothetical protein n=1 Tax=Rossellomorea marisflavi TaxID=189381 RepID=UPI00215BF9E9|nr:hypothetical protein [Rossellomorea marisflavi]
MDLLYKRVLIAVAGALFLLLSLLAVIVTDLYDRDFPQALQVKSRLNLNFNDSSISVSNGLSELKTLDDEYRLDLVKLAPDLSGDGDGQIYAKLNDGTLPSRVNWFSGGLAGKVVGSERLASSYPDGYYLITGTAPDIDGFERTLEEAGVKVNRRDASIFDSLGIVVRERGFAAAVIASFALIATLALFWLSLRARGRALRVLAGCPTHRIHVQDLSGFGGALLVSAGTVAVLSTGYVGFFHGWVYVWTFLKALLTLQVTVISLSLLSALIMSASSWPSAGILATRQPAVKSLRSAASVLQALTFLLVVAAAGPAWTAYKQSASMAEEMAQWKQLSDQASIVFATDMSEMDQVEPAIGELVKEAESQGTLGFSYTYTKEMAPPVHFGEYSAIAFVNQKWIDLVTKDRKDSVLTDIPVEDVPDSMRTFVDEESELLGREMLNKENLTEFRFLEPTEGFRMPVGQGGGGDRLLFGDDFLIVVLPSVYGFYNDSSLTSMISSSNLMFTGVTATQKLLENHQLDATSLRDKGIQGELKVVYYAEEGILLAQFAAYVVWLLNLALVALIVAFTLAAAISALISALMKAKRDLPIRLAGESLVKIVKTRVIKEVMVGIFLVALVLVIQKPEAIGAVVVASLYGVLAVPLCHLFATRWCFNKIIKRQL